MKPIALLACLLVAVSVFGATITYDMPAEQSFCRAFVFITTPDTVSSSVAGGQLYRTEASAGLVTRFFRVTTPAASFSITLDADVESPLDIPAPDNGAWYGSDAADANLDGQVNVLDLLFIRARLGAADPMADVTGDGKVDIADLELVKNAL